MAKKRKKTISLPHLKFRRSPKGTPPKGIPASKLSHAAFCMNLPPEFQRFLRWKNGGLPDKTSFCWTHPADGKQTSIVYELFGVDVGEFNNYHEFDCIWGILRLRHLLPRWAIPIGFVDDDSILVTFEEGDEREDQIWLKEWCHDIDNEHVLPDEDVFFVADTMVHFLRMLTHTDDEYDE